MLDSFDDNSDDSLHELLDSLDHPGVRMVLVVALDIVANRYFDQPAAAIEAENLALFNGMNKKHCVNRSI